MSNKRIKYYSYLFSISLHFALIIVFAFLHFSAETARDEYVTIGFGTLGSESSSGTITKKKEKKEKKQVDVPKIKNTDEKNETAPIVKKSEKKKTNKTENKKGKENQGKGSGNFGFEIDFGGKGVRKIYSYVLPPYPEGVNKEIDIKLRFAILPDGAVGNVLPLIKADARLEMAAIQSLKQWRFEPLPRTKKTKPQFAIIIFPYRLQ